jgi:SAM-dependent methyltransferase
MKFKSNNYYDKSYFAWQSQIGTLGGIVNSRKFDDIGPTDCVLDFGCGGGFLLANIDCKLKIGIEINDSADNAILQNGVTRFKTTKLALQKLGENSVDYVISNHALEHTYSPYLELLDLYKIMRPSAKIHIFIPSDLPFINYNSNDINQHLYSWSKQNIGNLFKHAGFRDIKVNCYFHKWPPFYRFFWNLSPKLFDFLSFLYSIVNIKTTQLEVVAYK